MDYFAGLDVSLETVSMCIVNAAGDILLEKKAEAEPAGIIAVLKYFVHPVKRIGLEAGPTSMIAAFQAAREPHARTMVIDGAVTLIGSMNWTATDSEDLDLVSSSGVAAAYAAHWHNRLAASIRFNRREDWCRVASQAGDD